MNIEKIYEKLNTLRIAQGKVEEKFKLDDIDSINELSDELDIVIKSISENCIIVEECIKELQEIVKVLKESENNLNTIHGSFNLMDKLFRRDIIGSYNEKIEDRKKQIEDKKRQIKELEGVREELLKRKEEFIEKKAVVDKRKLELEQSPLQRKESKLSSLEEEERTIAETEALIDKQTEKDGQDIGEE